MPRTPHRPPYAPTAVVLAGPWASAPVVVRPAPAPVRLHRSRSGIADLQVRLVVRWLELSRCAATVSAHGEQPGLLAEAELLELLGRVEDLVCERVNDGRAVLDGLADWSAALVHEEPVDDASCCLVCRRARAVPEDLRGDLALAIHLTTPPVELSTRRMPAR